MRTEAFTIVFSAVALAFPTLQHRATSSWVPTADSTVTCTTSDKVVSNTVGPPLDLAITNACAAMMPECAYPDRVSNDTICVDSMDWQLKGPASNVQAANVEDASTGNKMSGWSVEFSVTPATSADSSTPVMWQTADCFGYFNHTLMGQGAASPKGCWAGMGAGVGVLTVGGTTSLKGTIFNVSIVAS